LQNALESSSCIWSGGTSWLLSHAMAQPIHGLLQLIDKRRYAPCIKHDCLTKRTFSMHHALRMIAWLKVCQKFKDGKYLLLRMTNNLGWTRLQLSQPWSDCVGLIQN
jgi:hypothetical protein